MVDNIDPELLKNGDIFDFDLAANTYYFPVDDLLEDNFQNFINTKIKGDYIKIRKSFINKDFQEVRNLSHKLKSVFSMLGAMRLYKCVEQMQKCIDNKTLDNIEEIYISLIKEMNIFFKELVIFSNNIDHPISQSIIREYEELSRECDINESDTIKSQLNSNVTADQTKNDDNIINLEDGKVVIDRPVNGNCCTETCIII
jgi:HPt (histidine-containing phosphotransfer) domain-containing protein